MSSNISLDGLRVLIVEDDFYLATDGKAALEEAGALVVGPFARAEHALPLVDSAQVDCAIVDINLGQGPSYAVATALGQRGIPFLFTTGYDAASIPERFRSVPRLEKPIEELDLLRAVDKLRRSGPPEQNATS